MCIAPNTLIDGRQVGCRECWQCRRTKVDDIVGRGIAELRTTPVGAHFVTLTYGRDRDETSTTYGEAEHERAVVLTYSDPQKLFKLLRVNGFPFRYLIAGEYGSTKGRAHFHVVFFWQERVPPGIVLRENIRFVRFDEKTGLQAKGRKGEPAEFWPHGHTYWEPATYESIRYCVKYILKEVGQGADEQQYLKHQSKEPPLGTGYFKGLAERYAEEGLAPRDGFYDFPEAVRRDGKTRVQFRLSGATERRFIEAYVDAWGNRYGAREQPFATHVLLWRRHNGTFREMPHNEWLYDKLDKMYGGGAPELQMEPYRPIQYAPGYELLRRLGDMIGEEVVGPDEYWADLEANRYRYAVEGVRLDFDAGLNAYYYTARDGRRWHWLMHKGVWKWQNLGTEWVLRAHKADFDQRVRNAARIKQPWLLRAPSSAPLPARPASLTSLAVPSLKQKNR